MFLDDKRRAQPDGNGAFGYRVVLNDAGLETERINLDADGKDAANRVGILKQTRWYDTSGNIVRIATVDAKGSPTPTRFGDAGSRFEYDAVGNVTRVTFYDAQDQPVLAANIGFAGLERTYDAHGNLTSLAFFGPDRRLTPGPTGPAKVTIEWEGNDRSLTRFYGASGKPAPASRIFQRRQTWNRLGLVVEETYLDDKGTITRSDEGCATVRLGYKYDDRRLEVERAFVDTSDRPTMTFEGWSALRYEYDQRGYLARQACFDVNGRPVKSV